MRSGLAFIALLSLIIVFFIATAGGARGQQSPVLVPAAVNDTSLPVFAVDKSQFTPAEQKLESGLLEFISGNGQAPEPSFCIANPDPYAPGLLSLENADMGIASEDSGPLCDLIYVYINLNASASAESIVPYVYNITDEDMDNHIVVAWVEAVDLKTLAALEQVRSIEAVRKPQLNAGSRTSESDAILHTASIRSTYGFTGQGIKVGVISDGVDSLAQAQASGDLPANVHVLSNSAGGNEGTAMLEIIYDEAPGAELYFHDWTDNHVAFNSAIDELVNAGCTVIVDDVTWLGVPYFEDGIIASHITSLVNSRNIVYITSAGNHAKGHYQGLYYPDGSTSLADFSRGTSPYKYLYFDIPAYASVYSIMEWNDPWGASSNDYDLFLYNAGTNTMLSYSINSQTGTQDPIEGISWTNPYSYTVHAVLYANLYSGQAKTLEIITFAGDSYALPYNTNPSDSIFGHAAAAGVIAAGAIDASDSGNDAIEYFSSQGPSTIYYPSQQVRAKPEICGIDGVLISGAGGWGTRVSGNYRFYGTSAAAPSIAGLVAQAWSGHPGKTAAQIRSALTSSAVDLGSAGCDNVFGYGRADALQLQQTWPRATVTGRLTTQVTTVGIANARVDLINSADKSRVFGSTYSDAQGYFTIPNIEVIGGVTCRLYANSSLLGEGYSNNFTLSEGTNTRNVFIVPRPDKITISINKSALDVNPDIVEVSAYMTDALNNPVADGLPVSFSLNNTLASIGAIGSTGPGGQSYIATTAGGYAYARCGWAGAEGAILIKASFANDPAINASKAVAIARNPPDGIKITSDTNVIMCGGDQAVITAQLYFNGQPCSKPGVAVTFSQNNSTPGYLPTIKTNITAANGQAMIILTSASPAGAIAVTASALAGNGIIVQNSTTIQVINGGSITGVVKDKYLAGVPGATVKLWTTTRSGNSYLNAGLYASPENPQLTVSSPSYATVGSYGYHRVPAGVYNVTVEKVDATGQNRLWYALVNVNAGTSVADIVIPDYVYVSDNSGRKPIQVVAAPPMQGSPQLTGGVSGRITTYNLSAGVANAYVAIVNASNTSQAYYVAQTNAQGFFQFTNVHNTFDSALNTYRPIYKLYTSHDLFGDGYSGNFSVEMSSTAAINVILASSWNQAPSQASGSAPAWPGRTIKNTPAPAMKGPQTCGGVVGRFVAKNTGNGLANACVEIVNASNTSQAYYVTQTDASGNFQFLGVNNTFSTASGTYIPAYRIYGFAASLGECLSDNFSVECCSATNASTYMDPWPAGLTLSSGRTSVIADSNDHLTISAYVTDGWGFPVSNNWPIDFAVDQPGWSASANGSIGSGDYNLNMSHTPFSVPTHNGYANVTFGWVNSTYAGNSSKVKASYSWDSSYSRSITVNFVGLSLAWNKTFDASGADSGNSIVAVDDGYVIAGSIFSSGRSNIYLVKTDMNGSIVWQNTFNITGEDSANSVIAVKDGYVMTGQTKDIYGYYNVCLVKTDLYGNLVWNRTYGGSSTDIGESVIAVNDGYVIAGLAFSYGHGSSDVYLIKTDLNGSLAWNRTFGGSDWECGYSVAAASDGYVITGLTSSYGNGNGDVYLVKTDFSGNLVWAKTYGGPQSDDGHSVVVAGDGYVIAGSTASYGDHSVSSGSSDVYLIKTDLNGGIVWQNTYGGPDLEIGYSLVALNDGYVIAGKTNSYGNGREDVYLVKADLNGKMAWNRTYGGASDDEGLSVVAARDSFVVAGRSSSYGNGNGDMYVVKINVIPPNVVTFTFNLKRGWTMISVPLTPANDSVFAFFPEDVRVKLTDMWYYDHGSWVYYSGTRGYSPRYAHLTDVMPGKGYWVKFSSDVTFTVSGEALTSGVPAAGSGWTMIGVNGFSSLNAITAYSANKNLWYYDNGQWYYYSGTRGFSPRYPHLQTLEPGNGYWVNY